MIETYRGVVYPNQVDHIGHMNVQWYAAKFDEATWHFVSNLGITPTYLRDERMGMAALPGDLLVVKSRLLEIKEKSIRFLHQMLNAEDDTEIASCELFCVHFDGEARKSCPFPEEIYEKGRKLVIA